MTFLTPSIIKVRYASGSEYDSALATSTGTALTLSDHSRSPLAVNYEIIEKTSRMADGTMRRYVVGKKNKFSCQWSLLPTIRSEVADGKADARDMKEFYDRYCYSPLSLDLYYMTNATERGRAVVPADRNNDANHYKETKNVFWTSFTFDVVKRLRNFDYWNLTAEFTEI